MAYVDGYLLPIARSSSRTSCPSRARIGTRCWWTEAIREDLDKMSRAGESGLLHLLATAQAVDHERFAARE